MKLLRCVSEIWDGQYEEWMLLGFGPARAGAATLNRFVDGLD